MLVRGGMPTSINNRTTINSRDPMNNLEQELRIRNFSSNTISSYLHYNKEFLRFASSFSNNVSRQDIKDYLDYLISSGKSVSTVNQAVNALKFYYEKVLARKFFSSEMGIKRPKKEKKLPVVLSKQEIVKMINVSSNIKHKLIVQILYSTGLRVSELRNLEINDIDFNRKCIFVKNGKGKKDRITVISLIVLKNIERYLLEYKPVKYLFESFEVAKKMSVRSMQKTVTNLAKKVGIKKRVSAHSLRHSFATRLLENNVNLRYIQSLLGYARLETTQIYTKVATNNFANIEDLL